MEFPITEKNIRDWELELKNKEGEPISEHRREHARMVAKLMNDAYYEGYNKAISENNK